GCQPRHLLALPFLHDRGSTEGEQTHHGPDFEPGSISVRQAKDIVIKSVLLVPHAVLTNLVDRSGDQQKLDDVVRRQFLIDPIVYRELARNLEHVLAEQGNPGSAVGLFQISSGWQRRTAVEHADIVESENPSFE